MQFLHRPHAILALVRPAAVILSNHPAHILEMLAMCTIMHSGRYGFTIDTLAAICETLNARIVITE